MAGTKIAGVKRPFRTEDTKLCRYCGAGISPAEHTDHMIRCRLQQPEQRLRERLQKTLSLESSERRDQEILRVLHTVPSVGDKARYEVLQQLLGDQEAKKLLTESTCRVPEEVIS